MVLFYRVSQLTVTILIVNNFKNVSSAVKPILRAEDLPIPRPPVNIENDAGSHETCTQGAGTMDEAYLLNETHMEPHLITQVELSDLIRDLYLSKQQAEILGSRLSSGIY